MKSMRITKQNLKRTGGLQAIKLFSHSTQLSTKFVLPINDKMPTIVGILTFISMINKQLRDLKQETYRYLSLYKQLKFCAELR